MRSPPHMSIPTQTRVWHPAVTSSNSQNSEVSCVPMCSRGVLRGGKSDRATADGDDELHPRLPHLALGRHGDALLETSLLDCCPCHSSHSCWIQVSWELVRCPTRLIIYISPPIQQRNIAQQCACWEQLRGTNQVNLLSRLIPESPSWLLVKGRTKEALEQLERVAQCNKADLQVCFLKRIFYAIFWYWKLGGLTKTKKQYSFLIFKQLQANEIARELEKESQMETDKPVVAKATLLQMFKTENLRLNAFLCTVIWWALIDAMMTCNFLWKAFEFSFSQRKHIDSMMGFMCYYGHVQNTSNLGEGNVYKSYFLGALVEIPCWSVIDIFIWFDASDPFHLFTVSGLSHS